MAHEHEPKKFELGGTRHMKRRDLDLRSVLLASAIAVAAAMGAVVVHPTAAQAQAKADVPQTPKDLTAIQPVPTTFTPKKTAWGDYDFRGIWPIENLNSAHILFQRPKQYGNRQYVTDEEFQRRLAAAKRSDGNYVSPDKAKGVGTPGTQGLADFVEHSALMRRTGMIISPADGQLPPLTPAAEKLFKEGRSSWVPGLEFHWVDDFDTWDRCISRGFPASMFPFRYNNGIRVFQSPGYITIVLEMLGTRVIPITTDPTNYKWPKNVESWMGDSIAHWEGKTLVIETSNIKSGDSASHDGLKRAAAPVNVATQNAPPFNTTPTSPQAHTVERLTMTGPNTMTYEVTYTDPLVYTAPWTARLEWTRDENYQFYEYACAEGDVQVRNYITASIAHEKQIKDGTAPVNERDGRERYAQQFDNDPGTGTPPGGPGGRGGGRGQAGGGAPPAAGAGQGAAAAPARPPG
jgi:hypothetical protein